MIRTRKAFTLIELMVVIGILLVLIGLVAIGLSQVGENQKAKSTQHVLEGLMSMHEELKAKTNLRDIDTILKNPDVRAIDIENNTKMKLDDQPFNNDAVVQTQRIMKKMLAVPTNKSTVQQLPSDRFLWDLPAGASVSTDLEKDGNKLKVPLPLDAWGNVILYVPPPETRDGKFNWRDRYGLRGVYLKDVTGPQEILNPRQGYPDKNDFVMLRTFRPFWMSAGPDGRFGKMADGKGAGDDNIYSFENNQ